MIFDSYTINILNGEWSRPKIIATAAFLGAAAIGAGANIYSQQQAGKTQSAALSRAQRSAEREASRNRALQNRFLALQEQAFAAGAPIRSALSGLGLESIGLLQQDLSRQPGESPLFQRALERGTSGLATQLGGFGLSPTSRAFSRSTGELAAGLTAQEIEDIRRFRLSAAQLGSTQAGTGAALGFGQQALQAGGLASQLGGQAAQFGVSQGAVQAGGQAALGQTLGALPQQLLQFQLLSNLGLFGGGGAGGGGGGSQPPALGNTFGAPTIGV